MQDFEYSIIVVKMLIFPCVNWEIVLSYQLELNTFQFYKVSLNNNKNKMPMTVVSFAFYFALLKKDTHKLNMVQGNGNHIKDLVQLIGCHK